MGLSSIGLFLRTFFVSGSGPVHAPSILMEDSGYLLLESGDTILLE